MLKDKQKYKLVPRLGQGVDVKLDGYTLRYSDTYPNAIVVFKPGGYTGPLESGMDNLPQEAYDRILAGESRLPMTLSNYYRCGFLEIDRVVHDIVPYRLNMDIPQSLVKTILK